MERNDGHSASAVLLPGRGSEVLAKPAPAQSGEQNQSEPEQRYDRSALDAITERQRASHHDRDDEAR